MTKIQQLTGRGADLTAATTDLETRVATSDGLDRVEDRGYKVTLYGERGRKVAFGNGETPKDALAVAQSAAGDVPYTKIGVTARYVAPYQSESSPASYTNLV